ncbi:MAG: N-acetylglucosamine-6-phosphate deacetylase [Ruminococcaceae bacterium]|nr:N-acetylglucosamine-6-phosphate deacetylase [Oscillospiraceae bacterium]
MLLHGGKVLNEQFQWEEKDVLICDGKIEALLPPNEDEKEYVDVSGMMILPGLVDTHIHGADGTDTMSGNFEPISKFLVRHGVTSFLPTTMTMPLEEIQKVMDSDKTVSGAQILGFHLEGPYVNEKYKGAQNEKYIKTPDWEDFDDDSQVKMLTIAPELEGSMEYIKQASEHFTIALGHSDCDYETACRALEAGASSVTHLCNAMRSVHHREPGLLGAGLEQKGFYTQVIADGIHIHPGMLRLIYQCKGSDKMVLISDAMSAAGLPDGIYELGGQTVYVKKGEARIEAGNLAGSTTNLWDCVCLLETIGIPFEDAVKMASLTPAKMIGATGKGAVGAGFDADLIVTDENRIIKKVMVGGAWADIS